jgi:hypothetical protein
MGRRVKLTCCKAGVENSPALAIAPRRSSEGIKPKFGTRVGQKKSGGINLWRPVSEQAQTGQMATAIIFANSDEPGAAMPWAGR